MSLIITPYNEASKYASGGQWEATQANFPSLLSFFKFDEAAGSSLITDAVSGVTLTFNDLAGLTFDGTKLSVTGDYVNSNQTLSGTLNAASLNNVLTLFVATGLTDDGGNSIKYGAAGSFTRTYLSDTTGAGNALIQGQAANATSVTVTRGTITGFDTFGILSVSNGTTTLDGYLFKNGEAKVTGVQDATATKPTAMGNQLQISVADIYAIYGIMQLQFTNTPSDAFIRGMINWMSYQWKLGNKWVYPGIKGLV